MMPKNEIIEEGIKTYQATCKYSLLLRVIILMDLNIKVYKEGVRRYIEAIEAK